jgi:hypothetical protein
LEARTLWRCQLAIAETKLAICEPKGFCQESQWLHVREGERVPAVPPRGCNHNLSLQLSPKVPLGLVDADWQFHAVLG